MSLFKYAQYVAESNNEIFDQERPPGASTPHSAIYRCMGCGREVVSESGKPLPPQNHHQHSVSQGAIRWKLIVYAQSNLN